MRISSHDATGGYTRFTFWGSMSLLTASLSQIQSCAELSDLFYGFVTSRSWEYSIGPLDGKSFLGAKEPEHGLYLCTVDQHKGSELLAAIAVDWYS